MRYNLVNNNARELEARLNAQRLEVAREAEVEVIAERGRANIKRGVIALDLTESFILEMKRASEHIADMNKMKKKRMIVYVNHNKSFEKSK